MLVHECTIALIILQHIGCFPFVGSHSSSPAHMGWRLRNVHCFSFHYTLFGSVWLHHHIFSSKYTLAVGYLSFWVFMRIYESRTTEIVKNDQHEMPEIKKKKQHNRLIDERVSVPMCKASTYIEKTEDCAFSRVRLCSPYPDHEKVAK